VENTVARDGKRHVGLDGRIMTWRPLKPIFFKLFQPGRGLANVLRAVGQTADDFWGNSLACGGNLILLGPYEAISKIFRTDAVQIIKILNKRV
jgi:hypothetical protein